MLFGDRLIVGLTRNSVSSLLRFEFLSREHVDYVRMVVSPHCFLLGGKSYEQGWTAAQTSLSSPV